jgi:uncharacterized membrane protein (UPF0136 family)
MSPTLSASLLFAYALLILLGGIMGYCRAGSLPSLIASLLFFPLLACSAAGWAAKKGWSVPLAFGLVGLLLLFFAYRWAKTHQLWPSGALSLLGALLLLYLVYVYRSWK